MLSQQDQERYDLLMREAAEIASVPDDTFWQPTLPASVLDEQQPEIFMVVAIARSADGVLNKLGQLAFRIATWLMRIGTPEELHVRGQSIHTNMNTRAVLDMMGYMAQSCTCPPVCPNCAADLRAYPFATDCPECGHKFVN